MDNLSGVATIIELAKILPGEISNDMEFVFFGGEELGSWGAAGYVQQSTFNPQEIRALINLDAFGSKTSELEIGVTADLIDLCRQTTDQLGIVPERWNCPPRSASDHKEFIPLGVPSVWIANNGADKFYHTPLDRVGNISLSRLKQAFKLSRHLSQSLAEDTVIQP
jgi:Zn-dependent M28 family amino/carboxypeptidase